MQIKKLNDHDVILREYDFERDPPKIVKYLFDKLNSQEGISKLREGDKWFHYPQYNRVRLVAEIDGELYATVTIEQDFSPRTQHKFHLYSVVAAPQFRGTGLIQLLFNYMYDWVQNHGGMMILVDTWEDNVAGRKFYEKMRFKQYGILPKGIEGDNGYVDQIFYYQALNYR